MTAPADVACPGIPPSALRLTSAELDVCWAIEGLDAQRWPVELHRASPGRTRAERAAIVGRIANNLGERGLLAGNRLTENVADLLHLLAHPGRTIDAWVFDRDQVLRAIGAAAGTHAVIAAQSGVGVALWSTDSAWLPPQIVRLTGEHRAGPGESVSVRTAAFASAVASAAGDQRTLADELTAAGLRPRDAGVLARMCAGAGRRGQFGACAGSGAGRRRAGYVAFHDTPSGRYGHTVRTATDGVAWTTVSPADNGKLLARLTGLVGSSG